MLRQLEYELAGELEYESAVHPRIRIRFVRGRSPKLELDQFEPSPPPPGTTLLTRFRFGSATPTARHRQLITRVARNIVAAMPRLHRVMPVVVQLEGHEDEVGDPARFGVFGRRRAAAVAHLLARRLSSLMRRMSPADVRDVEIQVSSAGPVRPIRSNTTAAGRAMNRRVEIRWWSKAIRDFQRRRGLPADGIVGPDTERALLAARRSGPSVTTELNERYEGEIDYENVPLSAADSSLVTRVVPADIRKVVRNADGSLRTRSRSDITHVVIHSLAGHYTSAVENWRTGRRLFKPHYVIREDGEITQVVAERHIPQHGNRANSYSVGIEHDGFTKDPSYLTDAMYVSSAALTRDICLRNGIPMDRTHIIGHDEAPGTGHGDPGGYWDWDYYLALVRWDGHAATRPIRLVIDYNSYSFWPTSDHWRPWSRTPIRHNPHPKHSWGPKYYRAQPARDATDAAVFLADIPVTGTYELSAWWPVLSSNNPEVMIKVLAGHQFKPVFSTQVNQKTRSGRVRRTLALPNTPIWYRLGSVTANTGDTVWVEVSRRSSKPGWIVADAVRLLKT